MLDNITINAHSSIRIAGDKIMYFDPFLVTDEPHDADIIFFTHSHYDHFSPKDFVKLANDGTLYVAPASMKDELKKAGITNAVLMTPGEEREIEGVPVKSPAAYNIAKQFHKKECGWLGYVVTVNGQRVYVCGDTDDNPDVRGTQCDVIMLPVGGTYTMTAKEAARLVNDMRPKFAIPTHYGSAVGKKDDGEKFAALVDDGITVVFKL